MTFGLSDEIMLSLINVLKSYPCVDRAVIFGSRARGDHKYNSDIDLAVYAAGELPPEIWLALDEAAGIYKIDVVDMGSLYNEKFRAKITQQGIEVFRK